MKNLVYAALFLALVGAAFMGCGQLSNESSSINEDELTSNNGDEIQNIINETMKHEDFQSMSLVEDSLYETDFYKVLVLGLESDSSTESVLIVVETSDNCATLIDSESIRFVKISDGISISGDIDHSGDKTLGEINGKTSLLCKGSCCKWMQISADHFRCDCLNAVDVSTGEGCTIEIVGSEKY